jgi:hypothetical protein
MNGRDASNVAMRNKGKKKSSALRSTIEIMLFIAWLGLTGLAGYYMGYDPNSIACPDLHNDMSSSAVPEPASSATAHDLSLEPCPEEDTAADSKAEEADDISGVPPLFKEGGYSFQELKDIWSCSHATGNDSQLYKDLLIDTANLDKTKWKSILTVEPKKFFDKYLTQYPADTRALQPVVVFSHKPLSSFDELSEVCKVMDIAVVPDKPGVCVAVTETYHDVASYHMLHADRQKDGSFALTSNHVDGRTLPSEQSYAAARALLLDYFKYNDNVDAAMKDVPKFGKGKVVVGVLVEDATDVELFLNSFASATKAGVSKGKFCVFTTSKEVKEDLEKTGVVIIYLPQLAKVGTVGDANVGAKLRRHFLQSWLGFAVANDLVKMMWQTPGTVWFERPDNIIRNFPAVETLWSYKGRKDGRAAPFFVSYDFFVAVGVERPIHLLHELILHFDLVMAWDSLDAVASYRLTENNSRLVVSFLCFCDSLMTDVWWVFVFQIWNHNLCHASIPGVAHRHNGK